MVEGERRTDDSFEKIVLVAKQLAAWDSRIVRIFHLEDEPESVSASGHKLICEFNPEPHSVQSGLNSCLNLLIRADEEGASQYLEYDGPLDLGLMWEGNIYLPDGEIVQHNSGHSVLFRKDDR